MMNKSIILQVVRLFKVKHRSPSLSSFPLPLGTMDAFFSSASSLTPTTLGSVQVYILLLKLYQCSPKDRV